MWQLSTTNRSGTLTVAGTAGEWSYAPYGNNPGVTGVTVNGQSADLYNDGTFAATGFTPANGNNTYTAVAQDNIGRSSTASVTVNLPASPSYNYDANGNLLSDGTRNFAYDCENELTSAWVAGSWSNNFVYDGLLRKRIEKDYSWNGSAWLETNEIRYVYDGYLVVQERNVSNLPQVTYTRGNDLSGSLQGAGGIGGLLARTVNPSTLDPRLWSSATAYYFNDAQGNIVAMVDTNGNFAAQYEYDPFGNMVSMSGPLASANHYRFSSKEWDDGPGLYYYGFRFYDPNLQRWPNRDPIQEWGGWNLYEFAGNSPINYLDIFGLKDWSCKETKGFLDDAKSESLTEGFFNHSGYGSFGGYGGTFDFKMNPNFANDTFNVDGKTMRADQFGNYIAGYGGEYAGGPLGYAGVRAGGILYDAGGILSARGRDARAQARSDFNWDADSVADINAGADRAKKEMAPQLDPNLAMMNSSVNHVANAQSPSSGCH